MAEVAILTPDPAVGEYALLWPVVLARLQATLHDEGIRATPTPWTAHVDDAAGLRGFARVLALPVWSRDRRRRTDRQAVGVRRRLENAARAPRRHR